MNMFNFKEIFPNYDVDEKGNVYKCGTIIKPFKSNKYLQVVLFDVEHKKRVFGVHTVVAMKYLGYFTGCVVHHIDGDTRNNALNNLEIFSRNEHSRLHGQNNDNFKVMNLGKVAWNRGLKMSNEFRKHCSDSAKRRWQKQSDIV